ncbi:retrovirus-related pol polyprotein from transposon TNT 1-94 [Tanacetum coccineum]|uniref:Retrovirus-related pol polyprotein from transposon TNT 1-94 n=1 Tax=Tanacetum coccineum TaxID=301880 RepID=A0ABQ4WMX0_9ASTR
MSLFEELCNEEYLLWSTDICIHKTSSAAQAPQDLQTHNGNYNNSRLNTDTNNASTQATDLQILHQDVDELDNYKNMSASNATIADNVPNAQFRCKYYALNVSTVEPKNVTRLKTGPCNGIDSMQEELLQFKRLDVWVLGSSTRDNIKPLTVGNGYQKQAMMKRTRFFYNFARMEAIRIFLAYDAHKSFIVFQMDVKSAFLHGTLKEEDESTRVNLKVSRC